MKKLKYLLALIVIAITVQINAQSDDVKKEPGYVDFGDFNSFEKSTGVTEVVLEEDLLSVLASISDETDPNIMSILNGLKLVKANIYEVDDKNKEQLKKKISDIDSKLSNTDWKRIVRTRSKDESANVYIRMDNNKKIVGLVVTNYDDSDEAAFVNIVGKIDLATIGKLGKKFNIPSLEDVNGKN